MTRPRNDLLYVEIYVLLTYFDTVGWTWGADASSLKQKTVVRVSLSFVRAPAHPGYPGSTVCKNGFLLLTYMVGGLYMFVARSCNTN